MLEAQSMSRRTLLTRSAQTLGAAVLLSPFESILNALTLGTSRVKGRLKQSACRWCYNKIPLEEFAKSAAGLGLQGVDLLNDPKDWPVIKKYGLVSTMTSGAGTIPDGCNRKDLHDQLEREFQMNIPRAAENGVPNVITFSGNRRGMSDGEGLENTVLMLNRVKGLAEKHQVTICLELLNSKVDHRDYMADHTTWGAEVIKRVNSPRVKLLYDIYHMQSMSGDHIRNIQRYGKYISHYHTGGHPGRNEIDETQEIYYPAIVKAIVATGYKGYIGQEFVPKAKDKAGMLESLKKCVLICDV